MDNYPHDSHYNQQSPPQQQQQRQQPWPPHLLPPGHHGGQSSFPSPVSPPSALADSHYPAYYHTQQQQQQQQQHGDTGTMQMDRTSSTLSLNLSSLSVASPTNLSPINPSPMHSHSNSTASSTLSPVTPISPSQNPFTPHHHQHHLQSQFQYTAPDSALRYDDAQQQQHYDLGGRRALSSRSSSSSEKSVPRKRSFTNTGAGATGNTPLPPPPEESGMYDDPPHINTSIDLGISTPASYEDMDPMVGYVGAGGNGGGASPIDGSTSGGEGEDMLKPLEGGMSGGSGASGIPPGSMNILGKPMGTNNFVTKLYQMINDPKSAHFIAWTELGTSFVVSNVGEFSRSILGSHFKHNNFSSFVRQLNMYGFHKINRTPRAQRTSTDAQTWEFSHHKFLRGRPDLLDEIKRKALEPDPAIKHRVELPGEVAAQLGQMRDENRRVWEALSTERRKVERLVGVVKGLWDVVGKNIPGSVHMPFPSDLLETTESPNIYVTSPTASSSRYPPPLSMSMSSQSLHSLHSLSSPNSSPTTADFPASVHNQLSPQTLSRQHSFQHISFRAGGDQQQQGPATSTPLPPSPGSASMELYDNPADATGCSEGRGSTKRQRTSVDDGQPGDGAGSGAGIGDACGGTGAVGVQNGKRISRARSDSAPLGYGLGVGLGPAWQHGTRPRSGSGLAGRGSGMQQQAPNMGTLTRVAVPATPMLSMTNGSPAR